MEELVAAATNIKNRKAPGPDGIPPEAIKAVAEETPEWILGVLNRLLLKNIFPKKWKAAKLLLIPKGKIDGEGEAKYRPICLLDTISKLYEALIKKRLEEEMRKTRDLSDRQYGFRKNRSTVDAIKAVIEARSDTCKWCILATLDVKNAFNTASWSMIMEELQSRGIAAYLRNVIGSYLSERKIWISNEKDLAVHGGVPQGSILGPVLWNILYDGVLEMELPEGAMTVGYADDLAVLVKAQDEDELLFNTNEALRRIEHWMKNHSLELAPEKTELVVLKGPRRRDHLGFRLGEEVVRPSKSLKYLGVILDQAGTFKEHLEYSASKAEKRTAVLARIMPNVGGPSSGRRQALNTVVQSILLYGAPIWIGAMETECQRKILERAQRKSLLRLASGYRTVSTKAIQVIAGVPPIWMLAAERAHIYSSNEEGVKEKSRAVAREVTLKEWQKGWSKGQGTGTWTKKLIPNIKKWVECQHRKADYWLTQALSGHGAFGSYLKRFKKREEDTCIYCVSADTPEHTLFECKQWDSERQNIERQVGHTLTPENMVNTMIKSIEDWDVLHNFIKLILKKKAEDGM